MRNMRGLLILVALLAVIPAHAQLTTVPIAVTGAGAATFGSGAVLSGVTLSTMRFGIGVDLPGDGTASGSFQATLIAASRKIVVEGLASSGSSGLSSTTFSGTCSINLGDGSPITTGVPFTVTIATPTAGTPTLGLVIGATTLPAASVSAGAVRVK